MAEESTTPYPVELVRRTNEAAKRGDVGTVLRNFGPDSVWDDTAIGLGTHDGLEQIREHLEDWIGSYEEFEIANEEMLELGKESCSK